MRSTFRKLLAHKWFTPLGFGTSYWLLDAIYTLTVPMEHMATVWTAFFPSSLAGWLFRIIMFCVCALVGMALERLNENLSRTKKLLFLTDYAIEHTKAFALFWFDETGRILRVNEEAANRLGYTKKEILALNIFKIDANASPDNWAQAWAQLKEKKTLTIQTKHRHKNGSTIPVIEHFQYLKIDGAQYDFAFVCDATACPLGLCRVSNQPVKSPIAEWGQLHPPQVDTQCCAAAGST